MPCPHCGAPASSVAIFCGDCGHPLQWLCPGCASENPAGKRFCYRCGAGREQKADELPTSHVAIAVERRQLTVMFVDLVDSTGLGTRLEPEDLHRAIGEYQNCVADMIERFGGHVARYLGDGVLVYFGYPMAEEDDAERAIRAGLAVTQAVSSLHTVAGPAGALQARGGVATGLVVVGEPLGNVPVETGIVGNTLNFAARLQTVATPGSVVICDVTRRLAGDLFSYTDLGRLSLKGFDKSQQAWLALSERPTESRFNALRSRELRLVGRDEEVELLTQRWNQASSGEGQAILLSGEPGIGKSRLIATLEDRIEGSSDTRIRLACSPHGQDSPLDPIIRYFKHAADLNEDDSAEVKGAKLRAWLLLDDNSELDIYLTEDLLSIPRPPFSELDNLPIYRQRELIFKIILMHFNRLVIERPTLLIIEDLHWADPTTREFLDLLIERVARLRMLIVVSSRPEYLPPWMTYPNVTVRVLGKLHPRYAFSLISNVMDLSKKGTLPSEIVEQIVSHADGVPLFIEELAKTVLEEVNPLEKKSSHAVTRVPLPLDIVPKSLQAITDGKTRQTRLR